MKETLPNDPWHKYYEVPDWLKALLEQKSARTEVRSRRHRKVGKEIQVLDPAKAGLPPPAGEPTSRWWRSSGTRTWRERFAQLRASSHPQAQFMWWVFRDMLHYCAVPSRSIADNARDLDLAIRWGLAGTRGRSRSGRQPDGRYGEMDRRGHRCGKSMAPVPLPAWVAEPGRSGVHTAQGSWSVAQRTYKPRPTLPVYRDSRFRIA